MVLKTLVIHWGNCHTCVETLVAVYSLINYWKFEDTLQNFSHLSACGLAIHPKSKEPPDLELIKWSITRLLISFNFLIIRLIVWAKSSFSCPPTPTPSASSSSPLTSLSPPPRPSPQGIYTHLFCVTVHISKTILILCLWLFNKLNLPLPLPPPYISPVPSCINQNPARACMYL